MGGGQSLSLEIQIANNTRKFTLENPRTFIASGKSCIPPSPEVPPGSSDSCRFSSDGFSISGLVAYEAESFTLAILFLIRPELDTLKLGLELSLDKAHLGSLEDTFLRILEGKSPPGPEGTSASIREIHRNCQEPVQVSAGHIKVTATMSHGQSAVIRVALGERGDTGKEISGTGRRNI